MLRKTGDTDFTLVSEAHFVPHPVPGKRLRLERICEADKGPVNNLPKVTLNERRGEAK